MTTALDHLVFATPDLQASIAYIETLLGVTPVAGGNHPGMGTSNALVALGTQSYLEIIGPDPRQTDFQGTRPFGIDHLDEAKLVNWAARRKDLSSFIHAAKSRGVSLGDTIPMSRETPQGEQLDWELAFPTDKELAGIIPFLIDWGQSPHPAVHCPKGARLKRLELEHPRPLKIVNAAKVLELDVNVIECEQPGLRAVIECPRGEVVLR